METFWDQVKTVIKAQLPDHSFRMWIEPLQCRSTENGEVVLSCPNSFSKKRVQENYHQLIQSAILRVLGKNATISFVISRGGNNSIAPRDTAALQLELPKVSLRPCNGRLLRKDYTFDQFVVGKNNDFAYSASLSLASQKDASQCSLLLFSSTGMGKSHLTQAAGHHILGHFPRQRVFYMTAEDFSNEMVRAYRQDAIETFKGKYRNGCDVLLLEDVHHLSGKNRTQLELTNTLDSLFEANKKIIFSSCYRPAEIPKLHDSLRSRLSCGLVSNIEPPDFRTRFRILQRKARQKGFQIPENVLEYLASELTDDIRQLESGLISVTARASLLGCSIKLDLAEAVLKNIVSQRRKITVETIKKMVCKHFEISPTQIVSRSRKQSVVRPRQIAMYLARNYTDSPLQEIGRSFNRYHATALHGINTIEKGLRDNPIIQKQIEFFHQKIKSGKYLS
jgi:chromosomal replication initiator protein